MMRFLTPMLWGWCRAVAWALQLAGFTAILAAVILLIWRLAGRIEGL